MLTTRFRSDLTATETVGGVTVRRLPTVSSRALKLPVNLVMGFFFSLSIAGRVDVIHGHCLSPFVLGALLAAKLRGCPVLVKVCSVGANGDIAKIKTSTFGALIWALFRRADLFVAPTTAVTDELINEGAAFGQVSQVPNLLSVTAAAVDSRDERLRVRNGLGLDDRTILLYVGRLGPRKGLIRLMRIWPEVARRADVQLVLVGDGPQRPEIERWLSVNGLEQSVILAGYCEDPAPYYRAADIFVFPSRSETFGNVIVEAMSHGLPVATTRVGVVDDWPDDVPVMRLDNTDCAKWIPVLRELTKDAAWRAHLGAQAADFIALRYGETDICMQYKRLYQQLLAPANRRPSR